MAETNEKNLCVGDLVRVSRTRTKTGEASTGPALIVDRDHGGWFRVRWLQPPEGLYLPDGYDRWFPSAKLIMISRACEKDEESFKKNT